MTEERKKRWINLLKSVRDLLEARCDELAVEGLRQDLAFARWMEERWPGRTPADVNDNEPNPEKEKILAQFDKALKS